MQDPLILERIAFLPTKVLDGEIYRLLSFLVTPPSGHLLWAGFFWYLFYLMGTALEQFWGTFRFNVYLLIGYMATVAVAFLTPDFPVGNNFMEGSVFLAFAYLNPNFQLMLAFIVPVRIKWFALITWGFYVVTIVFGSWSARLNATAGVLNFFVFFGPDVFYQMRSGRRFMTSQAKRFGQRAPAFTHQCNVCGLTDKDDRNMDFRYCSQCSGDLCYCSEHLRDHEHIWNTDDESGL